jgi:SprT-like family
MTLPLTPEMLAAAYDFLSLTPPFDRWNMPPSDETSFKVSRSRKWFARYRWDGIRHTIEMSANAVAYSDTLFAKLSHEMIHMHLEELGMEGRGGPDTHSGAFRSLAEEVCKHHGFDPKAFY